MSESPVQQTVAVSAASSYPAAVPEPVASAPPSLRTMAIVVHALYAAGFLTGFTAIIGLVIAYVKRGEAAGTIYASHFTYAIRTFWIGLAMAFVGILLSIVGIGLLILPLVGIWFIVRVVRAFLSVMDNKPIANPSRFF